VTFLTRLKDPSPNLQEVESHGKEQLNIWEMQQDIRTQRVLSVALVTVLCCGINRGVFSPKKLLSTVTFFCCSHSTTGSPGTDARVSYPYSIACIRFIFSA